MKLKIGELAKCSGLSIRTLHHYDAIHLLCPTERTLGGARLYGHHDFRRLHRIQVLKSLGYSLADIGTMLDDAAADPLAILDRQARQLEAQARRAEALSGRLRHLSSRLAAGAEVEAADWLSLLEMMTLYEQHLTEDEVQRLRSPRQGTAQDIEAERTKLVSAVREGMRQGLHSDDHRARALAWRWVHMVIALTSNDAVLAGKLRTLQERNRRAQDIVGIDAAVLEWIDEAIVHARLHLFSKYMSSKHAAELRRRQLAHKDEWPVLVGLVRAQMKAGAPCDAKPMQVLAVRWQRLFRDSYCGDDPKLAACVRRALAEEPRLSLGVGVDEALMRYVRAAGVVAAAPAAA